MFASLPLRATQGLSDERFQHLIEDRLSFMRFLRPGQADPMQDTNRIWASR